MILARRLHAVFIILLALHFAARTAFADDQNCYYPNGDVALGMGACSPHGGSCCPLNWQCLSDGLCYLENADYYGRYTCTSQDWASNSLCPNYCTQNLTAAGNEAIQWCSDGSWCCDSNRDPKNNCCDNDDAETLNLGDGGAIIASISSTSPPTSATRSSTSSSSSSTKGPVTISSTSTPSSTSPSSSETPRTLITTASQVTSNSAGVATTIISIITSLSTPSSTPTPASDSSSNNNNNRSLVVGLGAGIPGLVLAASAIGFLLYRLRRKRQLHEKPPLSEPPGLVSMYRSPDDTPELDSTLPVSKLPDRKSELYGSTPSEMVHSPAVSSMTGSGNGGGEPPFYSPTSGGVAPGGGLSQVQEESPPAELWGSEIPAQQWPGQQPYRAVEPEQRMSQTFRVSGQQDSFAPYRPPPQQGEEQLGKSPPRDY